MAKAIALARSIDLNDLERRALDTARFALVSGCAFALIAAGRALPF